MAILRVTPETYMAYWAIVLGGLACLLAFVLTMLTVPAYVLLYLIWRKP